MNPRVELLIDTEQQARGKDDMSAKLGKLKMYVGCVKHTSIFPLKLLESTFGNCSLDGKDAGSMKENGIVWMPFAIFSFPGSIKVVIALAITL